jgi:hypothetical protein
MLTGRLSCDLVFMNVTCPSVLCPNCASTPLRNDGLSHRPYTPTPRHLLRAVAAIAHCTMETDETTSTLHVSLCLALYLIALCLSDMSSKGPYRSPYPLELP